MISHAAMWWWGGVAMAVVAACGVVWAVGGDWWATLKLRKAGALRRCRKCFFDMSGLTTLVCPECGKTAKSEKVLRGVRRRWGVASLCMLLFSASWVVSRMPEIRSGRFEWVPTSALLIATAALGELDPSSEWGVHRSVTGALETAYFGGEVSAIDECVHEMCHRVLVFRWEQRAAEDGRKLVETRTNIGELIPDENWRADEVPDWGKGGQSPINSTRPYLATYPSTKKDWTLQKWNRRQQFERYLEVLELYRDVVQHATESESHYDLNLASGELIRCGDPAPLAYMAALTKELESLRNINCFETHLWFSSGTVVGGEVVRVFYWQPELTGVQSDDLYREFSGFLESEEVYECEQYPRVTYPVYWSMGNMFVVRAEPNLQEKACATLMEIARRRGKLSE